ncbi:uncharacterized protein LOC116013047 [Ipomoea triloba]|uniref:uncharacterized protein LOC116013047 n=1 Tax=Ipomoea triloba TaxID=35885 RepID=UPI00125E4C32|nr:uncharacterized protein LOC116013047 [Ipomoea triloba]
MAWFAVTSLMRTLELEFLPPNPRVVLEDTNAAEALHGRLRELLHFLEKSEDQFNAEDVPTQGWKARLKDVAMRIEDAIESKIIHSFRGGQCTIPLAQSSHYIFKYAIEELTKKFVKEDLQMKGILSSRERIESTSSSSSSLHTASELQSTMVGRTAEFERIKRLLLEDKSIETLVLSIVGMAGIGKTTFARSLYQDPLVKSHFDVLAWATVCTSTTYDSHRILLELLLCIEPEWKEFIHEINDDLPDLVHKRLVGRRYLVVLDDIWDINQWEEIKRSFPENFNESRILLTSRHDEVAMYARSYNHCSLNLPFLNSEESWLLFHLKVHPRLHPQLEAIWRHIVHYFKGLPFAIVIAAGLAQAINESLWISKEIERIFYERMCSDLVQGISKILILSYNNLPNFLKICFLYLGIFPESSAIPVNKLIKLWVAEGFVKVEGQRSLEEVAEDFLKDLVSRSLVLIDKISLDGKIRTCKVHDIVHEFCKRKAMEEGLLHVVDGHFGHLHAYPWVSIEIMDVSGYISLNDISNRSRSILSFCHGVNRSIGIANFKKLRVLDLSTLSFKWNLLFTNGGVDLVLLRYLTLRIYSSGQLLKMWKLKESFNLQTLVLLADKERRVSYTTKVYEIWRMPMLRHLKFSPVFMFDTPNVVLEYLQTIYWLQPSQCTKEVFLGIRNAKVMGIFMPRRMRKFVHVRILSDDDKYSLAENDDEYSLAENWLDDLINLQKLEKLKINSHRDDPIILPPASAFPVQLRMLTLKGTLLPWDAMEEVIGMLPNLEILKLKFGACKGQYWKLSGGGFPKLKSLLIQGIELKQWTATDNAFPILERLIIKHCIHLEIPSIFVELYTLQLFELYGCQSLLVNSAKQIQQQQEELFGYNWLVVHDYNTHQVATIIEEKEHENRGQQECKKLKYKASYPDSSYYARQVQEEEDSKLTNLEFLQPHPRLVLHHIEAEAVEALHRRLAQLLTFLDNDSENQLNDDDGTTKEWKSRIKEVALRIEDEIESEIIDIFGREDPRWRFLPRVDHYKQPQRFLATFQNGTGEFMELVKNKQPMKDDDDDIPSSSQKIEHHSACSKLLCNWSSTMVGRDDQVNMILELLVQDSRKERRVVPIVGMGGIGKTKFAQTLYEDPSVSSHFDVVAWTTVSAQPVMRQMLLQLLSTMQISHTQEKEIINKSNEELADLLRKCLMGRRYLIVVDDLWSTASWDEIQRCFPEDNNGSRILVTTRLQEVAISTGGSHNYSLNLPFLNSDESWELFSERILSYGNLSLPPMRLEGIWGHIVEYCKGLPLAIVIVAGLVQTTNESLWESQSEEMEKILCATVTSSLLDSFSEILRLSYNHLPNVLRVCFLYLGVFPEDSAIPTKKLIRLWIAEGFVKVEEDQRSLEEVAEDYLKDLVSRSLVLVDSLSLDGKIKSCKVHDIVHDFCRNEAIKEGLLHVAISRYFDEPHLYVRTTERWLSFESMYPKLDVHTGFNRYGSLFCFHDDVGHGYRLPATPHFKRLRVLDLGSLHFINGIPSYIADLILLRYLALRSSKSLNSLPVLKDWNLQTLVLLESWGCNDDDPKPLIHEIWELPKLRHLQVCTTFVLCTPTAVHQYLQTVQWLRPFQCTEQVFLRIPNAKVMGIFMEGSVEFGEPNCLDNLSTAQKVETEGNFAAMGCNDSYWFEALGSQW